MIGGVGYFPEFLCGEQQRTLVAAIASVLQEAPFFTPVMPRSGKSFSVCMTNTGPLGWLSDRQGGYRYQACHPNTGRRWPPIPQTVLDVWSSVAEYSHPPEACLINYYRPGARMGLHQDRDEEELAAPVVSISLGDTGLFRIAADRQGPSSVVKLRSGDVLVMAGPARLSYHGIDRILGGSSRLLTGPLFPDGGRINLTLRRVTRP
ncbi:alpha-ketoglutarate-dependent dioxygenase AlkB [Limibacillus sp. MBR-115]|uniref:alpha-ketoglutarate-dependent dioxygenase AlkB family protein n=1 Tax=Limibacillus sp. MBR-115 TaxID=3156465 RepID=UPI0033922C76